MAPSVKQGARGIWLVSGWLWIAAVCWFSLMPHPPQPFTFDYSDKLEHLLTYFFLMTWFSMAYRGKQRAVCAGGFAAMGVAIEIMQGLSGYRQFEFLDMAANAAGVLLAWWAVSSASRFFCRWGQQ